MKTEELVKSQNDRFESVEKAIKDISSESEKQKIIKELYKMKEECIPKNMNYKYWDCNLAIIEKAITEVFWNVLNPAEQKIINNFRKIRNKLVHGDLVGLMEEMKIAPEGREIYRDGSRNILKKGDIIEAVKGFHKFSSQLRLC